MYGPSAELSKKDRPVQENCDLILTVTKDKTFEIKDHKHVVTRYKKLPKASKRVLLLDLYPYEKQPSPDNLVSCGN